MIEHRHLRSAVEFAVLMAAEGQKRRPAIPHPKELKPFFHTPRIPSSALGRLRRVIEADPVFRQRLAAGVSPELVDEIGCLWLRHDDDWEAAAAAIAARREDETTSGDVGRQLRRADKQRDAAEKLAVRTRAELVQRDEIIELQKREIDELRAEVAKAEDLCTEMRAELVDARNAVRHARDREAAAVARAGQIGAGAATPETPAATPPATAATPVPPAPVAGPEPIAPAAFEAVAAAARLLADTLESMASDAVPDASVGEVGKESGANTRVGSATGPNRHGSARREPLRLPSGVIASSAEAAEVLVRSDATIIVDGYNVAMLGWPGRPLEEQRNCLLDRVENLCRRFDADVIVIFDGASIVGAHAGRRRLARVVYSPSGTTADDVIRDEVRRLPIERSIVVVTNDAEIVRDVRVLGANALPSNAFLAVS